VYLYLGRGAVILVVEAPRLAAPGGPEQSDQGLRPLLGVMLHDGVEAPLSLVGAREVDGEAFISPQEIFMKRNAVASQNAR